MLKSYVHCGEKSHAVIQKQNAAELGFPFNIIRSFIDERRRHIQGRKFTVCIDCERFRSVNRPVRSGKRQASNTNKTTLYYGLYGHCDLSIHLSVNLEYLNAIEKSSLGISKLHKNALITLCVITLCDVIITLCEKSVTLCGHNIMYHIMRKSYYVMQKLLRYAKNVLHYTTIITLCGVTPGHTATDKRETRNDKSDGAVSLPSRNEKRETRNSIVRSLLTPISTPIRRQISPFLMASLYPAA